VSWAPVRSQEWRDRLTSASDATLPALYEQLYDEAKIIYDQTADCLLPKRGVRPDTLRTSLTRVFELIPTANNGERGLVVGCSCGVDLLLLDWQGYSTFGVDIMPTALKACQQTLKYHHSAAIPILALGERLPFGNQQFRIVAAFETIEHMRSPTSTMTEWRRVLQPGGLLILTTMKLALYGSPEHLFQWDEYEFTQLAQAAGFRDVKVEVCKYSDAPGSGDDLILHAVN
jgi:SAM-dependent methyltransferase